MSLLLSLPTELLEVIIEIAVPYDGFENFVTSCKTVYEASGAHIKRYNNLRRTWRCTRPAFGKHNFTTSLDIIEAIAEDLSIAWFIEDLDLSDALDLNDKGQWDDDGNGEQWLPQSWVIRDEGMREEAKQLVMKSPALLAAGENPEDWLLAVHAVDENGEPFPDYPPWPWPWERQPDLRLYQQHCWRVIRTLFLLTLLPKLKQFRPPSTWGYIMNKFASKRYMDFLVYMVRRVREDTSKSDLPLGQLQQLLPFEEVVSQPSIRSSLEVVAPFTILPSLTDMHVSNSITVNDEETLAGAVTDETGIPFLWPYEDAVSNLHTIKLEGSAVNAAAIAELLAHTPHVTSFEHTHSSKYRGCEDGWDAGAFVDAIGKHIGPHLKELRIGFYGWSSPWAGGGITSLKDFQMLETLKLHLNIIGAALPDLLPRTIRSFTLEAETEDLVDRVMTVDVFKRVDELGDKAKFPNLEHFVLETYVHRAYGEIFEDWQAPEGVSMPLSIEGPLAPPDPYQHRYLYRIHFDVRRKEGEDSQGKGFKELEKLLKELRVPTADITE